MPDLLRHRCFHLSQQKVWKASFWDINALCNTMKLVDTDTKILGVISMQNSAARTYGRNDRYAIWQAHHMMVSNGVECEGVDLEY